VGFTVVATLLLAGCDITRLTANSTANLFERAAPAFQEHWDYELAGKALPSNIIQSEGVLRVVPDNEKVLLQAIRAYTGYAYGWIEDDMEAAELEGDLERADHLRERAGLMYVRARDLGQHWIGLHADGMQPAVEGGLPAFEAWLEEHFDEPEHAPMLLWTGYPWGSYINVRKDDMAAVADLPFAKALVKRSVDLDPDYFYGAGLTFLATSEAMAMGGDLEAAKEKFERALAVTERRSFVVQVNYARSYAIKTQDKELYVKLLREVVEAGDVLPEARLQNQIAKRRAARYLEQTEMYFVP
jgi:hypothetical protein